jgi:1,4-dihydroxy-2-naphthoyl-CoA hydrolase
VNEPDAELRELADRGFTRLAGFVPVGVDDDGAFHARLEVGPEHLSPHGYLHAGVVVTLADTACGFGCLGSLPGGKVSFTTIELKANFLGTAREGSVACVARLAHGGRTTQVWDAEVTRADGRRIALFRATQLLLDG